MKSLVQCLLLGLCLPLISLSQCPGEWVRQFSGVPEGDYGLTRKGLALDYSGNMLVSGSSLEVIDLSIGPLSYLYPNGGPDFYSVFLSKLDEQGGVLWTKVIESEGNTYDNIVLFDTLGGAYLGGAMRTSMIVNDTIISRPGATLNGFFLIKFDESGEVFWTMKGGAQFSIARSAATWGSDIVVCIVFQQILSISGQQYNADVSVNPGNQDMLIARISPDGELVSSYLVTGKGNLDVRAIDCDQNGCIVQGKFAHELTYGVDTLTTAGPDHYAMYQLAIDNNGLLQWANVSQNQSDLYLYNYGLDFTTDGEVRFSGVYDFSPITLGSQTLPMPQGRDVFLGALDRNTGEVLWLKKNTGSSTDYTETLDVQGNSSLLGGSSYSDQFQFDGFQMSNTADDQFDGFIVSTDSSGKVRCGLTFPGVGQNAVRAVKKTADGHVMALVSFEQLDFGGQSYTAQGRFDMLLIKTCLPCDTLTSITETTATQPALLIYPNPASQTVRLQITSHSQQVSTVTITDMLGKKVLNSLPNKVGSGEVSFEMDISTLAPGLYTISATLQSGETLRQRLVVQR
jgi:hypothetical protein